MARSLLRQRGSPVPIHLYVFYSREEDAHLVYEGAQDGASALGVTLIQVPGDRIMQRAMHYTQAHKMHSYSHTIFCDSDLWFPPDFFAAYAPVISETSSGYWSCRVFSIPEGQAEEELSRWTDIQQERLASMTTGRRYDKSSGHVGHFQCVPRDLATYPADPRLGVEVVDEDFASIAIALSEERRVERRLGKVPVYHFDHPSVWNGTGGVQL